MKEMQLAQWTVQDGSNATINGPWATYWEQYLYLMIIEKRVSERDGFGASINGLQSADNN